jgi:hypothetical protein
MRHQPVGPPKEGKINKAQKIADEWAFSLFWA